MGRVMTSGENTARMAVVRLTPEQIRNTLEAVLGVSFQYGDYNLITDAYGVALGGVDFQSNFERDPSAKVQTLLVARGLAWAATVTFIFQEFERSSADRLVFTVANMEEDGPDNDGSDAWNAQLVDIYWRLLARAPTAAEVAAVSEAFVALRDNNGQGNGWAPYGWMGVIYALLSTEEFWNI